MLPVQQYPTTTPFVYLSWTPKFIINNYYWITTTCGSPLSSIWHVRGVWLVYLFKSRSAGESRKRHFDFYINKFNVYSSIFLELKVDHQTCDSMLSLLPSNNFFDRNDKLDQLTRLTVSRIGNSQRKKIILVLTKWVLLAIRFLMANVKFYELQKLVRILEIISDRLRIMVDLDAKRVTKINIQQELFCNFLDTQAVVNIVKSYWITSYNVQEWYLVHN